MSKKIEVGEVEFINGLPPFLIRADHLFEEQINNTNVSDLKQLFYGMIESQTSKAMLAEVRSEYAFRVIDPAIAPELKNSPFRAFITLLSVIYSLIAITVLCVMLYINNYKILFTRSPLKVSLSEINRI